MASQIELELPALDNDARAETGQLLQSTLVELIALSRTVAPRLSSRGPASNPSSQVPRSCPRRFGSWVSASRRSTNGDGSG
jgi:hypothetical protein